ncbi:DNA-binding GntR family transcriptional regulator [Hoeflea marina]|uniref:DNA-binding GntR family transcriptional regulator n=1 Tax=Hoeflea marina TaxID=274592 RepID=A0A317PNZ5_9HYPH|nr:GntR family transcriptional regulator [Hoeflea marina]PWW01971.1 DNA-binding GntR family transcriptional regulator [Hoeflea marina]
MEPTQSHAHAAYRDLEQRIVTLDLRPGMSVTERQLIDLVGLGRTPVREALQRLSWEGLIEIRPRSGILVTDIRPEDYQRVMEPRLVLEPVLAASVARHADAGHRQRLAVIIDAMEDAASDGDVESFLKADKACDEVLADACPNPFITRVLTPLQTHSRRLWFRFGAATGPAISAGLHIAVMRAICAADEPAAEAAMRALMRHLRDEAAGHLQ